MVTQFEPAAVSLQSFGSGSAEFGILCASVSNVISLPEGKKGISNIKCEKNGKGG
jgi:hypothetical protein